MVGSSRYPNEVLLVFDPHPSSSARAFSSLESKIEEEHMMKHNSRPHGADFVKSDLPSVMSLNLAVGSGNKVVASNCKRKRTDEVSPPSVSK